MLPIRYIEMKDEVLFIVQTLIVKFIKGVSCSLIWPSQITRLSCLCNSFIIYKKKSSQCLCHKIEICFEMSSFL